MQNDRRFLRAKYCLLVGLILASFLASLFFTATAAAERSLTIQQVSVTAKLLPDASMQVTERLTIDFSGQWNGFYTSIPQGNTPIVDIVVSENGRAYTFNPGTEYGPPGTYLVKKQGDNVLIDWSHNALNEKRTFDVSYRVINAVQVHNDVAELYRQFIGAANENPVAWSAEWGS